MFVSATTRSTATEKLRALTRPPELTYAELLRPRAAAANTPDYGSENLSCLEKASALKRDIPSVA